MSRAWEANRRYAERTTAVACPACGAGAGAMCVGRARQVHAMRASAARREGERMSRERVQFVSMAALVPPGRHGVAEVTHFEIDEATARTTELFAAIHADRYEQVDAGRYAKLRVRGQMVMTDTRMERLTNWEVLHEARGHVLLAGLGLGMIVVPILAKPDVAAVTVVEKEADVVALVEPSLRRVRGAATKLRVEVGDIFGWRPSRPGRQFDTIYFDIWPDVATANLQEMKALRGQYKYYLRRGGWSGCWREGELRGLERRGRWR